MSAGKVECRVTNLMVPAVDKFFVVFEEEYLRVYVCTQRQVEEFSTRSTPSFEGHTIQGTLWLRLMHVHVLECMQPRASGVKLCILNLCCDLYLPLFDKWIPPFLDSENAQCNLMNAQIPRLHGTCLYLTSMHGTYCTLWVWSDLISHWMKRNWTKNCTVAKEVENLSTTFPSQNIPILRCSYCSTWKH